MTEQEIDFLQPGGGTDILVIEHLGLKREDVHDSPSSSWEGMRKVVESLRAHDVNFGLSMSGEAQRAMRVFLQKEYQFEVEQYGDEWQIPISVCRAALKAMLKLKALEPADTERELMVGSIVMFDAIANIEVLQCPPECNNAAIAVHGGIMQNWPEVRKGFVGTSIERIREFKRVRGVDPTARLLLLGFVLGTYSRSMSLSAPFDWYKIRDTLLMRISFQDGTFVEANKESMVSDDISPGVENVAKS
jgi:hypothetical protein